MTRQDAKVGAEAGRLLRWCAQVGVSAWRRCLAGGALLACLAGCVSDAGEDLRRFDESLILSPSEVAVCQKRVAYGDEEAARLMWLHHEAEAMRWHGVFQFMSGESDGSDVVGEDDVEPFAFNEGMILSPSEIVSCEWRIAQAVEAACLLWHHYEFGVFDEEQGSRWYAVVQAMTGGIDDSEPSEE
jgi:hypothetical protein